MQDMQDLKMTKELEKNENWIYVTPMDEEDKKDVPMHLEVTQQFAKVSLQENQCNEEVEKIKEEFCKDAGKLVLDDVTGLLITEDERNHRRKLLNIADDPDSARARRIIMNRQNYIRVRMRKDIQDRHRKLMLKMKSHRSARQQKCRLWSKP